MSQTTITARLPAMDIEILKRTLPEQNAECVTVHITATPSFDVAAQWLLASLFPFAAALPLWTDIMRVWYPAWQPRLSDSSASGQPSPLKSE